MLLILVSPLPFEARPSQEVEDFAWHMKDVHDEICKQIATSNGSYMQHADARRCHFEFDGGDMVMFLMKHKRFPVGTYKKQHLLSA